MTLFKRSTNRIARHDTFWQGKFKLFAMQSGAVFVLLQLLFLLTMLYLYGSFYKQSTRVHNFRALVVDYDGGLIGRSVAAAYDSLQSPGFPTVEIHSASEYATPQDVRNAVCQGHYWGALYTHQGASARLSSALGGGAPAASYRATDTMTVIWNAVRYPAFVASMVEANLQQLGMAAGNVYQAMNGTAALQSLNTTDRAAVQALLNPVQPSAAPIQPMTNGGRVMFNTTGMVMPILAQFFFILALNNISAQTRLLSRLPRLDNLVLRASLAILYTSVGALCMAGYIWAYKESWAVTSSAFALTWLALWLLMHIHFLALDAATALVPAPAVPFVVLAWVVLNVTSTLQPFELTPGFYHWAYALPALNAYELLVAVWSAGCSDRAYRNLPVLVAWWLAGAAGAVVAVRVRCADAEALDERERASCAHAAAAAADHHYHLHDMAPRPATTTANSLLDDGDGKKSDDRPRTARSDGLV